MVTQDIEKAVFDLIDEYNGPSIFTFKRYPLRKSTDLNEDFRMDPLDAYDLLEKYTEIFGIEPSEIDFQNYFPDNFSNKHDPLTIQLLIDSAKAGRWLGK